MDVDWDDEWDEDFDPPKVGLNAQSGQKWGKSGKKSGQNLGQPPMDEWDEDFDPPKAGQNEEWDDDIDMDTINTGKFKIIVFFFKTSYRQTLNCENATVVITNKISLRIPLFESLISVNKHLNEMTSP